MSTSKKPLTTEELERLKTLVEIQKLQTEHAIKEVELEQDRRYHNQRLAAPGGSAGSLVYALNGAIAERTVNAAIQDLSAWSRQFPGAHITININSPGGDVWHGFALYDHIRGLSRAGHHITTVAYGRAASMGGVLLQAGDTRIASERSWLLIHEVSSVLWGNTSEMTEQLELSKRIQDQVLTILASRSKLSKSKIAKQWKKTDWWLDASEMVSLGFADKLLGAK